MTPTTMIDRGTVAATTRRAEPSLAENPRTRRYAINPAIPLLDVHPTLSGRQQATIPYGFPLRFDTFVGMKTRNWSVDAEDKSAAFVETDLTAKEAVTNVTRAAWQGSRDMGFRELEALTPLDDEVAEPLLVALLPPLDPAECRYGSENTSVVTFERLIEDDDGNLVAHKVEVTIFRCLSCTLDWLESDACKALATSWPAKQLRAELLTAFQTNEKFFQASWAGWVAEMSKRERGENGLSVLNDDHMHVMRQLHETHPAQAAAETLRQNQQANADAMKEGFREIAQELRASIVPPAPVSLDDLKRQLLADPEFRKQLKDEVRAEEPKGRK